MKKKHIKILAGMFKEFHAKLQEKDKQLADLFDKILVWIISLSTGTIVFIVSSIEKLQSLNKTILGVVLFLLLISIISGIIGRILNAVAIHISYSQAIHFDFALEMLTLAKDGKLNGTETAEIVHQYILEDFGVDVTEMLTTKKQAPKEKWHELDQVARKFYEDYTKINSDARNSALNELKQITIQSFGLRKNAFEKKRDRNDRMQGILNRFLTTASYILYFLSASSFCIVVSYLAFSFLKSLK